MELIYQRRCWEYLACNVDNNIRELEGALISLLAQATLTQKEITMEVAISIVNKLVKKTQKELSVDYIQQIVCDYFGLAVDSLQSRLKKKRVSSGSTSSDVFLKKFNQFFFIYYWFKDWKERSCYSITCL